MIFPGDLKVSNFSKPNLAMTFVTLNILVFVIANILFQTWPQKNNMQDFQAKSFNQSLAKMYVQTLDPTEKKNYADMTPNQLSQLAIKDQRFWARASYFPFKGDAVQIRQLKIILADLKSQYQDSVQYQFGLGQRHTSPWAWVTYQFTHYSFMHLLSNLIFIFLIISYLEKKVAATWIALVYVLGGIGGGAGFLFLSLNEDLSVIGASGSVCALLGFLLVVKKNQTMPWTYLLAPIPGGYGQIYLPAFLIFPIYLLTDFSALLLEPQGIVSTIAHSAHVGGTLTGLSLGVLYLMQSFFRSKAASHGIFSNNDGLDELL